MRKSRVLHSATFGALLRQYRSRAKLTQEALAEKASLSHKTIGAWERGERLRPYGHSLELLSTALGLSEAEKATFLAAARQHSTANQEPGPPASPPLFSAPLTPLVGRKCELTEAMRLFESGVRLVTFTGTGGVGK